jgi:hypothetical protein
MNKSLRIFLSFLAFVAVYYFIFWTLGSLIVVASPLKNGEPLPMIRFIAKGVPLLIAALAAYFVWKKTLHASKGLGTHVVMGGLITGSVGFIGGFFGPMIVDPSANQGPLLGILITGPAGFLLGLILGAVVWKYKSRNSAPESGS